MHQRQIYLYDSVCNELMFQLVSEIIYHNEMGQEASETIHTFIWHNNNNNNNN